jgi:recombination protein RecT
MTKTAIAEVRLQLNAMGKQFEAALPKHIPLDRFIRVVMTAIQTNPALLDCDPRTLLNACMRAAQDGLLPDGKHGALVIYKGRGGPVAQWLPMIAGIRQQVRNSGEVKTWEVNVVHERDFFDYQLGDDPHIDHKPVLHADRGRIIAAYSIAVFTSGERSREVMGVDEIEAIRQQSKAKDSGPWVTHYGEMSKKTVARRHSKVLPMSSDLDDLLRAGSDDDEPSQAGPAIPGLHSRDQPARRQSLGDTLNMMVAPRSEVDQVPSDPVDEDQFDLITGEVAAEKEAVKHE